MAPDLDWDRIREWRRSGATIAGLARAFGVSEHRIRSELPAARATSVANRARWAAWREAGIDPTHGGEATERRRAAASARQGETRRRTRKRCRQCGEWFNGAGQARCCSDRCRWRWARRNK